MHYSSYYHHVAPRLGCSRLSNQTYAGLQPPSYTVTTPSGEHSQLVSMTVPVGGEIGEEVHHVREERAGSRPRSVT